MLNLIRAPLCKNRILLQTAFRPAASLGLRSFHGTAVVRNQNVQEGDDANFERLVLESKVPVLVDFYADWCGPCRMISPILTDIVEKNEGKIKLVKINVDDNGDTAGQYSVSALPTVVSFYKGKEVDRFIGLKDKTMIRRFVASLLEEVRSSNKN